MLLQLGPLVTQASGKLGGVTFQRSGVGTLARTTPLPTRRRTQYTNTERSAVQYLSRRWRALSSTVQDAWQTAADGITWTNRYGETIRGLGYWLFLRCNLNLTMVGSAIVEAAPTVAALTTITGLSSAVNVAGNTFTVSWTSGAIPAGEVWAVMATRPLSAGKLVPGTAYRYVTRLTGGSASPQTIRSAYVTRFGSLPTTAQRVWVKLVPLLSANGIPGAEVEVRVTIS